MHRLAGYALILLALTIGALPVAAQEQMFLFIQEPGFEGDSTDPAHPNWIEVIALDHLLFRQVTVGPGQPPFVSGQSSISDISLLKAIDKVSPLLQSRSSTIFDVFIEVCRPAAMQECYLRIELQTVKISDVTAVESTCLYPAACEPDHVESVSFNFREIRWIYTFFDGKGGQQTIETCWDTLSGGQC